MIRRPAVQLLCTVNIIYDLCKEAHRDHPCNSNRYINRIAELCLSIEKNYDLTNDGKIIFIEE